MLKVVNDVKWQQRISNNVLYDNLSKITNTIAKQRISFAVKTLYKNSYYESQDVVKILKKDQLEILSTNYRMILILIKKIWKQL